MIENRQTNSSPPPAHPFPISTMSKSFRGFPRTKISNHSRDFSPRRRAPLSGPLRNGRRLIRPTPTNRQTLICKKMTFLEISRENPGKPPNRSARNPSAHRTASPSPPSSTDNRISESGDEAVVPFKFGCKKVRAPGNPPDARTYHFMSSSAGARPDATGRP